MRAVFCLSNRYITNLQAQMRLFCFGRTVLSHLTHISNIILKHVGSLFRRPGISIVGQLTESIESSFLIHQEV